MRASQLEIDVTPNPVDVKWFDTASLSRFLKRNLCLMLITAALCYATFWTPYKNEPAIRGDGLGYHLWTRALLQRDLSFCALLTQANVGAISFEDSSRGVCLNKYSPGLALLRFPIMAPLVNLRPGAPLVSPAEHRASLIMGAVALLLVCILISSSAELLRVGASATNIALLSFVFGTGLFHYATYDGFYTHIYSALGLISLVWLWLRAGIRGYRLPATPLAIISFFLVLIRNTNILILAAFVLGYLVVRSREGDRKGTLALDVAPVTFGASAGWLLQIGYNVWATHHLLISSYVGESFQFARPMQFSVLFSYEGGLFTFYPVVGLALLVGLTVKRSRLATLFTCALIGAYVVLYGFWHDWALRVDFGHRGFVDLMPLVALVFAVALSEVGPLPKSAIAGASLLLVFATFELMLGYWRHIDQFYLPTGSVYWAHVIGKESLFHSRKFLLPSR